MNKLFPLLCVSLALATPVQAAEPNLEVELRWVEVQLNSAAIGAVRSGGYVVGTLGTVSPQGGGSTWSTQAPGAAVHPLARLRVQSGHQAGVDLGETRMQPTLELISGPGGAQGGAAPGSAVSAGGRGPQGRLRETPVERHRSVTVTPRLAGDGVQLELELVEPSASGQDEQHTTLQVPLNRWYAVAHSGDAPQAPAPGTYGTADAAVQTQRELQVRVTVLDR
ncbi:MAG: hypothetical protein JO224_10020 [Pelomonas sp.]|nr:hypothetical protein [Roseateles sp.]